MLPSTSMTSWDESLKRESYEPLTYRALFAMWCPFRDPHLLSRPVRRQAAGFLKQETSDGDESAGCGEGSVLA